MESCLSYIYPHTRVQSIVGILKTTAHNAFPVVTVYKDSQSELNESDSEAHVDTSNERFARTTTFSHLTSEQKLLRHLRTGEGSTLAHRNRTISDIPMMSRRVDIKGKRLKSDNDKDCLTYSSSAPGPSNLINEDLEQERVLVDDDDDGTIREQHKVNCFAVPLELGQHRVRHFQDECQGCHRARDFHCWLVSA